MSADADRNSAHLNWLGIHSTFSQLIHVTLERTHVVIPKGVDDLEVFVTSFAPISPRCAAGFELFPTPANSNTKVQSAVRQEIERCVFLGCIHGVVLGEDADTGAQAESRRTGGQETDAAHHIHQPTAFREAEHTVGTAWIFGLVVVEQHDVFA